MYSYKKKAKKCTISQLYFDKELYMFRTDLLSIIRSLTAVLAALGILPRTREIQMKTLKVQ
jgi:hypothetical protein